MPRPLEIIVKVHSGTDAELLRFPSIEKAVSYVRCSHRSDPIEYVMEIEKTAAGIPRGHDRREEFETAWLAEAYDDAIWAHSEQPKNHSDNVTLDEFLNNAEGPTFCEGEAMKVSRGTDLIAAE